MRFTRFAIFLLPLVLMCARARALRVQDVTRLRADIPNELTGLGLVFGLKGTGDGGDYRPSMHMLQRMLDKFSDPISVARELRHTDNVAVVTLTVTVPAKGAHEGDKLDVHVSALAAKSLRGGRLFLCPMQGPLANTQIYALAQGALVLDDRRVPTVATIKQGAVLTQDILPQNVQNNAFTLVLLPRSASYAMASAIADQINQNLATETNNKKVAFAADATSVVVHIPVTERKQVAAFIANVQSMRIPNLPGAAKVVIDSKAGTIVFTGDVELSPTVISEKGLTISVMPAKQKTDPAGTLEPFGLMAPGRQGSAQLRDLMNAFNMLKVPARDRIAIVKQLFDSGALHCRLEGH